MNAISKKIFSIKYKELSKLGIDEELMNQIFRNKIFKKIYKSSIISLVNKYDVNHYSNAIIIGIKALIKLNNEDDMLKCISIMNEKLSMIAYKVDEINPYVILDENFSDIFNRLRNQTFQKNIEEIILNKKSKQLVELINEFQLYDKSKISDLSINLINFINSDLKIDNISIKDYVKNNNININLLGEIINSGYEEGLLYTLTKVPSGLDMIKNGFFNPKILDMNFIACLTEKNYDKLCDYFQRPYIDEIRNEVVKIYEAGNYKLINDMIDYGGLNFIDVKDDTDKDIYFFAEKGSSLYYKSCEKIFLSKEMNISEEQYWDIYSIRGRIERSICKYEILKKYKKEYEFFNYIITSEYEKLKEFSSKYANDQINEIINNLTTINKFISSIERITFTELIKNSFNQLNKNNISSHILLNNNKESILSNTGKEIKVFELNGEPFTMMVHSITQKKEDGVNNGKIGNKLRDNPEIWDNEENGNPMISSSIIDNNNFNSIFSTSYKHDDVIYGFINIPEEAFYGTFNHDAGTNMKDFPQEEYYTARMNLPSDIMNKNGFHNEVIFNRKNLKTNEKFKPDYLVCYDNVDKKTIKHAQYFNIPIYVINTKIYNEQLRKIQEELNNKSKNDIQEQQTNARHM